MAQSNAVIVTNKRPPLGRNALAGAALGADIGAYVFAVSTAYVSADALLLVMLLAGGTSAVLGALVALAVRRWNGPLARLNRDLTQLSSMAERGLVGAEEYDSLKRRLIDSYQPQGSDVRAILRVALWAALVGMSFPLAFVAVADGILAALASGLVGTTLSTGGTLVVHAIQQRRLRRELPAGPLPAWEPLGGGRTTPPAK